MVTRKTSRKWNDRTKRERRAAVARLKAHEIPAADVAVELEVGEATVRGWLAGKHLPFRSAYEGLTAYLDDCDRAAAPPLQTEAFDVIAFGKAFAAFVEVRDGLNVETRKAFDLAAADLSTR